MFQQRKYKDMNHISNLLIKLNGKAVGFNGDVQRVYLGPKIIKFEGPTNCINRLTFQNDYWIIEI